MQSRLLTGISVLVMALVITNAILIDGNRQLRTQINNDQVFIQQSLQLETLYREMVKALADLSVKSDDQAVKQLLASLGINVTVNPAADSKR